MRKFLDEQGKLFGLINPVDLGVVILLSIAVWRIFVIYSTHPLKYNETEIVMGLLIKNVPSYVAQSISVGQDLFQDRTNSYLGKIIDEKATPAELIVVDNGKLITGYSPKNIDLWIKLKRSGRIVKGPARTGIFLGKLDVRIGDQIKAHTLYTSVTCEIASIRKSK